MSIIRDKTFAKNEVTSWELPNYWDLLALLIVVGSILLVGLALGEMASKYTIGDIIPISLKPSSLPYYALRTVIRMLIALSFSMLFTLVFGAWAAKSERAERIIIPAIDVLQSVPVLGFLSIVGVYFISLFPGSLLGPECAAIFAIFTSQVWNMTLSFYQSCRTVPGELREAAAMFQLTKWQSFWRLDVPFAMPPLIWNVMMSMSASWFFVVASEAITAMNHKIVLPGIGSYISIANEQGDKTAVFYAIIAMLIVILLYDQLLFRPLNQWIERFKFEEDGEFASEPWLVNFFNRTRIVRRFTGIVSGLWDRFVSLPLFPQSGWMVREKAISTRQRIAQIIWAVFVFSLLASCLWFLGWYAFENLQRAEAIHVFYLGAVTGFRVMVLILLSSIVWVPVGVWIGLRPRWTQAVQPVIQILAAFPANLLYPLMVMLIVKYKLNPEIWTSPLIILGTQWYILFNVIAGTTNIPKSLKQAANNLQVKGWLWWKRLILPGVFPYFVTGAITAAGGAWNASIIAEAVSWKHTQIYATGLGAYITQYYLAADYPRMTLGIAVMCLYVIAINRIFWRPLYNMAEQRFVME